MLLSVAIRYQQATSETGAFFKFFWIPFSGRVGVMFGHHHIHTFTPSLRHSLRAALRSAVRLRDAAAAPEGADSLQTSFGLAFAPDAAGDPALQAQELSELRAMLGATD